MIDPVKQIEIVLDIEATQISKVIVDYFVSNVEDKPKVIDIFCRFQNPKDGKEYEIKQRELRDIIDNHPEYIEQCVKDTVRQFLGTSKICNS